MGRMLRTVERAGFEPVGHGLRRRWVFRTGTLESDRELSSRGLRRLLEEQERTPVAVLTDGQRTWWMHAGEVVSARAELAQADVAALLADRATREPDGWSVPTRCRRSRRRPSALAAVPSRGRCGSRCGSAMGAAAWSAVPTSTCSTTT